MTGKEREVEGLITAFTKLFKEWHELALEYISTNFSWR
jgi:hypothetical protein